MILIFLQKSETGYPYQTTSETFEPSSDWAVVADGVAFDASMMVTDITLGTVDGKRRVVAVEQAEYPPAPDPEPEPPTAMERLEAQLTYTAMMTDTLIVEEA